MDREPPESTRERSFALERVVFFSDAVFAIAITLLAIELKVPDLGDVESNERLFQALLAQWSHYFAFALSFWIIAAYWFAHHRYFRYIIRYDGGLIGRNLAVLFFVALMPFTTLVLGEYGNLSGGLWLYGFNLLFLGLAGAWLWAHAAQDHRLVEPDLSDRYIRYLQIRSFATPAAAVIVLLASVVIGPSASLGWLLIWVFQMLIRQRYQRNPA